MEVNEFGRVKINGIDEFGHGVIQSLDEFGRLVFPILEMPPLQVAYWDFFTWG